MNGNRVLSYTFTQFDSSLYKSWAVRFLDDYYSYGFKMKNLCIKTDSDYVVELRRENSADVISYQTTKPQDGTFSLRVLSGINELTHESFGYEVAVFNQNAQGEVTRIDVKGDGTQVYSEVYGGNTSYSILEHFGYKYACLATIDGLDTSSEYIELLIRPYVLEADGIRRYGSASVLFYDGKFDDDGFPILTSKDADLSVTIPTDDTYVYKADNDSDKTHGAETPLYIRYRGYEWSGSLYRAAYFKFTLDKNAVAMLEDPAASAKFLMYIEGWDQDEDRVLCDLMVYDAGTGWTENDLTYNNYKQKAPVNSSIYRGTPSEKEYFEVDILDYLRGKTPNADGTITFALCVRNVGNQNAKGIRVSSKESSCQYQPKVEISNSLSQRQHLNLDKISNEGYEPWGYAEMLVDEWFNELRDEIYPTDKDGNLIYYNDVGEFSPDGYATTKGSGDYVQELIWKNGSPWNNKAEDGYRVPESAWATDKFARTLATLGTSKSENFLASEYGKMISEYDEYGGIVYDGIKGEATGFFHTEKIDGRTYIIDPLGNPYFTFGVNTVVLGDSENHKTYSLAKFGTEQEYFDEITDSLQDMGLNTAFGSTTDLLLAVENGLAVVPWVNGVLSYMRKIGCSQVYEGMFPYNNTVAVFDPDFERSIKASNAELLKTSGYINNPRIFGYQSDNELPSGADMLERYLTLNPEQDPLVAFSYATAWTFLSKILDKPSPTLEDLISSPDRAAINSEFLSFVYARNYGVVRDSIRAVDQNHMYLGSRVNGTCITDEGYHRVAGYYLDIITVNLYGGLNPVNTTISNIYRNSGKPYIVTEFFAKGMDTIDANGYPLANSTGAGIVVNTQEDRAAYYEHYVLNLLESKACVGWVWYRYRDNDQGIYMDPETGHSLIMLDVKYGANPMANTFMDLTTGEILTAGEVGAYSTTYEGEGFGSNQNVNKGIYNSNFNSVVTVYTYDQNGKLLSSKGYEVKKPSTETPAAGTVLQALKGTATFTIGSVANSDGTTTETVLTVYEGKYLELAKAFKSVSDHVMGLVRYFDAK